MRPSRRSEPQPAASPSPSTTRPPTARRSRPATTRRRSGTLTFAPGETTKTVDVARHTATRSTRSTRTSSSACPDALNASIVDAPGLGTITDDDPQPSVAMNDVTVTEGNTGRSPPASPSRSHAATGRQSASPTRRPMAPRRRHRLPAAGGTLSFAAGETTKTVTVLSTGTCSTRSTRTSPSVSRAR